MNPKTTKTESELKSSRTSIRPMSVDENDHIWYVLLEKYAY